MTQSAAQGAEDAPPSPADQNQSATYSRHQLRARATLRSFEAWRASEHSAPAKEALRAELERIGGFLQRRRIVEFLRLSRLAGRTGAWCSRLFLSYRDRNAVLRYIRFQEQGYPDGINDPLDAIDEGVRSFFVPLGKKKIIAGKIRFQFKGEDAFTLRVAPDPFPSIRRAYALSLKAARSKSWPRRFAMRLRARLLLLKAAAFLQLVQGTTRAFVRWGWSRHNERQLFESQTFRRTLARLAGMLLGQPIAKEDANGPLVQTIVSYCAEGVGSLQRAAGSNGAPIAWTKFLKVFGGALIGEHNGGALQGEATPDAVRRAFCWAATYPLVDDILDADHTSSQERAGLAAVMSEVFGDGASTEGQKLTPAARELHARMTELLSLIDPHRRDSAKKAILDVFEAHRRDALLRLKGATLTEAYFERLETSLLKSMLVRVATMAVCGDEASEDDLDAMAKVALFNQMGDDIWDVSEDIAENRATPVTLALENADPAFDPLQLYLDYGAYLCALSPTAAVQPVAAAIAHTWRLSHAASDKRIRRRLEEAMTKFQIPPAICASLVHGAIDVDPDALLFDLENIV